jgi:hypothetical protein
MLIFNGCSIFLYIFRYLYIFQELARGKKLYKSCRREGLPKRFEVLFFAFVSVRAKLPLGLLVCAGTRQALGTEHMQDICLPNV